MPEGQEANQPTEPTTATTQPTVVETPPVAGSPGETTPVDPPAPQPPPAQPQSKLLHIPTSAMSKIKEEERAKGRKAVIEDLDARAQENGFESHSHFMKAVAELTKKRPPAAPPVEPTTPEGQNTSPTTASMTEEERAKYLSNIRRGNRARAREEKERKRLEKELEKKDVERLFERSAIRSGVQDVDYAMTLLNRRLQNLSAEEAKTGFDEEKFFGEELKKSHPYLYGTQTRPATTGPHGSADPPPAPKPGETQTNGGSGDVDARNLSNEEYQNLLNKMGLAHPAGGM